MRKNRRNLLDLSPYETTSPFEGEGSIRERLMSSRTFVIYGNKKYHGELFFGDKSINEQIKLVKEFKLPVILLLDKKLSLSEMVDMRTIKGINVIKEIIYNFDNKFEKRNAEKEIIEICDELKKEDYVLNRLSFQIYNKSFIMLSGTQRENIINRKNLKDS